MAAPNDGLPQFEFESDSLHAEDNYVLAYHAYLGISRLYEIEVDVMVEGCLDDTTVQGLLDNPATITNRDPDDAFSLQGMVTSVELLPIGSSLSDTTAETVKPYYRLRLAPLVWGLTQTVRSRAFYALTVSDVLKKIFGGAGASVEVPSMPRERENTIQWEESDWDFIARLVEHDGYPFYFTLDGQALTFVTGGNTGFPTCGTDILPYRPQGGVVGGPAVTELACVRRILPTSVIVRDFHETTAPKLNKLKADVADSKWPAKRIGSGAHVYFGEGHLTLAPGPDLAKARAEEIKARQEVVVGRASLGSLFPGYKFTLEDHLDARMNREYLVIATEHHYQGGASDGSRDESSGFECQFEAIPAAVPYRPPRLTPWPRIPGVTTGTVTQLHGDTRACITTEGRYPVMLHFDVDGSTANTNEHRAHLWHAQPYAGPEYGMHLPLHEGQDVLIAFLEGNPDRPVIVAALPSPNAKPAITEPLATSGSIHTRSNVRIQFDDDA